MKTCKQLSWMMSVLLTAGAAQAQIGRGGPEWTTGGADAQRDSFLKYDSYISPASMAKPGFVFLWKQKLSAATSARLSQAVVMQTFIGYRGFKQLAFMSAGGNSIYALDYDLGRPYWEVSFPIVGGATACTTAGVSSPGRNTPLAPGAPGRGLGGSRPAYHSSKGKPGEGYPADAVGPGFGAPPPSTSSRTGTSAASAAPAIPASIMAPGGAFGRPLPVYFITSDGMLHGLGQSNGKEVEKPIPFLPAGSRASDVALVNGVVYAASLQGCAGANQVFALDTESKAVQSWKADGELPAAPALSSKGKLYVTAGKSLVQLEPKSLEAKVLSTQTSSFVTGAMLFKLKDKEVAAAGTTDSKIAIFDTATGDLLGMADVQGKPTALATYDDAAGARWLLVTDKDAAKGTVQALKLTLDGDKISVSTGWSSPDLDAPAQPAIINGVVFALSKGKAGKPATLYALDGTTGKKLWDSGTSVASYVTTSGLSASNGQVYFGTADNTLYAFGFPQERQ
ncbi:PQQ-binding-like beta-propeller repeat protein [Terriglobus albidus]|uniref:PQQ-binding-like beta-propeller repeat protein n=1 Tax=Terriglobus albidus TaxID=1592106 RepID=A0A5B9EAJ3_9BACT|nr:PQQ-binding-like beta-propeller repeat protein [Terriglobus albidus]QEE29173.1 PQQ-binding-like beta-propeller repeat protein [Terriglobus albidus]